MTFENHQQLVNLSKRPGYSVDFVTGDEGFFDAGGFVVDPASVVVNKFTKAVEDYKRKTRMYRGKEKDVQKTHEGVERETTLRDARSIGLRVSEQASTQFIKQAIGRAKTARTSSLAHSLS